MGVRYAREKTQSRRRQVESSRSCASGRASVDRAIAVRRREMASEVAFLRGEEGQWPTTSRRYSRKRISDRAGTMGSEVSITLYLSVGVGDIRAEIHTWPRGSDKEAEVKTCSTPKCERASEHRRPAPHRGPQICCRRFLWWPAVWCSC